MGARLSSEAPVPIPAVRVNNERFEGRRNTGQSAGSPDRSEAPLRSISDFFKTAAFEAQQAAIEDVAIGVRVGQGETTAGSRTCSTRPIS